MCKSIRPLFGIEKEAKDFRGSNAAAKAWLRGGFHSKERKCPKRTFFSSANFTKVTALLLRHVRVAYGKIAARQARGYGVLYKVKYFGTSVIFLYTHAVNRTYFSDRLAYGKMTLLNFSFMFGWYEVISLSNVPLCK